MNRHSIPIIPETPNVAAAVYHPDQNPPYTRPEPLRPPAGAPNVLLIMIDDVGFRRTLRVRWPVPHPHRRAFGRNRREIQPIPHHGSVLADACRHN